MSDDLTRIFPSPRLAPHPAASHRRLPLAARLIALASAVVLFTFPGLARAVCGDGVIERSLGEICDDGNLLPGDGCGNCTVESGWQCVPVGGTSQCTLSPTRLLSCPAWTPTWAPLNTAPAGTYGRRLNALVSGLDDGTFAVSQVSAVFPTGVMFAGPTLGGVFHQMYVNVNGNVTFPQANYSYTPDFIPFQTSMPFPIVAAWYADVDLRAPGSALWYCEDIANGRLIVTWENVGFYYQNSALVNSFQIVLSNPGGACIGGGGDYGLDIEFRYGELNWYVGDASGGNNGLCADPFIDPWQDGGSCYPAVAGVDIGDGFFAVGLPESGYRDITNVVNLSNIGVPGVWRWRMVDTCGNGIVNPCEQCDDGNFDNGDACTNLCTAAACGDGYVSEGVESCDGMNLGELTSTSCADFAPGVFDSGIVRCKEDCSDYDLSNCVGDAVPCFSDEDGDGFNGTSQVVPAGQTCASRQSNGRPWTSVSEGDCLDNPALPCSVLSYPGNPEVCDGCDNDCDGLIDDDDPELPYCPACGNGIVDPAEGCDDGNILDGDGCATGCSVEPHWVCVGQPSVCTCAAGWTGPTCDTAVVCGDGQIMGGEACDDGNTSMGDGCSAACVIEAGWKCVGVPSVCTDDNECVLGTDNCDANATCTNTPGSFICTCNAGYSGDGVTCADLDECAMGTDNCDANATCTNTAGSFTCACNSGYTGSGVTCADLDECALGTHNCSTHATCANTPGSFTCTCNAGFTGDGIVCDDNDECALGTHNCDANATCINSEAGFSCVCNSGYSGDGVTCADLDECALGTANCDANATCANTVGGFTCACDAGYEGDGVTCADLDECALGTANCDINAICANTMGGFTCICNDGYEGDGVTCDDINECLAASDDCDANATCTNTAGGFTCACNDGYEGDGVTCADLDECALGTANCSDDATCTNTAGGFTCACNEGFTGDGVTCEARPVDKAVRTIQGGGGCQTSGGGAPSSSSSFLLMLAAVAMFLRRKSNRPRR